MLSNSAVRHVTAQQADGAVQFVGAAWGARRVGFADLDAGCQPGLAGVTVAGRDLCNAWRILGHKCLEFELHRHSANLLKISNPRWSGWFVIHATLSWPKRRKQYAFI